MARAAAVKFSPDSVNYRWARLVSPERCLACSMFRPGPLVLAGPGTCTLVTGQIAPHAVCDRFDPRVRVGL